MRTISARDAGQRFGELLDMAQGEPVHLQQDGQDVAVVMSAAEYARLTARLVPDGVNPRVEELLRQSVDRWGSVYRSLSKLG